MSSSFKKAREYDDARKARSSKTGSTQTGFGRVGRDIDAESEKPRLQMHKFAAEPRPVEKQRADEVVSTREELDKLKKDEEKETDSHDFKREESKPVVRQAPVITEDKSVTQHSTSGVFSKAWTISDHVVVPEVIRSKKSSFIPNFIAATVIIESIEHILDGVEELKWVAPFYFSLPARIYWSVLFYIQILKAKESARKITKSESTWFRSFKRMYPLESLPVIGPLVPFYSNIVSVKPNDDMYDFIYPDYFTNMGLSVTKGVPAVSSSYFLQPNITIMTEFLCMFSNLTVNNLDEHIQVGEAQGGLRYFDDNGNFIPNRTEETFRFAGIDYPSPLSIATSSTLLGVGMDKPLPETQERLTAILGYWRRSKVRDIPRAQTTAPYDDIGSSMHMTDDFEWFEDCLEMATTQCQFFSDSINMSQIPSTGGSEVLVGAHITGKEAKMPNIETWFPKNWKCLKAKFVTTRADTTYEQFFNAAYALTTATISWTSNGHPIGGRQLGHRGGPYWQNRLFQYELDHSIEVQRRTQTMIRSMFFDSSGKASS